MRNSLLRALFVLVFLYVSIDRSRAELPQYGQELVTKLAQWEEEKRQALEKEIAEKRSAVVAALKEQMKETTKRGDLEAAISYKSEIDRLEAEMEKAAPEKKEETPVSEEGDPLPREEWEALQAKIGGKWNHWKGSGYFDLNIEEQRFFHDKDVWPFELRKDGVVEIDAGEGKTVTFTLNKAGDEITGRDPDGNRFKLERWPE